MLDSLRKRYKDIFLSVQFYMTVYRISIAICFSSIQKYLQKGKLLNIIQKNHIESVVNCTRSDWVFGYWGFTFILVNSHNVKDEMINNNKKKNLNNTHEMPFELTSVTLGVAFYSHVPPILHKMPSLTRSLRIRVHIHESNRRGEHVSLCQRGHTERKRKFMSTVSLLLTNSSRFFVSYSTAHE